MTPEFWPLSLNATKQISECCVRDLIFRTELCISMPIVKIHILVRASFRVRREFTIASIHLWLMCCRIRSTRSLIFFWAERINQVPAHWTLHQLLYVAIQTNQNYLNHMYSKVSSTSLHAVTGWQRFWIDSRSPRTRNLNSKVYLKTLTSYYYYTVRFTCKVSSKNKK